MESEQLDIIAPHPELRSVDICGGADPFVFFKDGLWHLLLHIHSDLTVKDYTLRSAPSIEALVGAQPARLPISPLSEINQKAWAAEVHDSHLYVTTSDGRNATHRMHVFESREGADGPWHDKGALKTQEDRWAIDLTTAKITYNDEEKTYAIWSGWEDEVDVGEGDVFDKVIPQNLYIAEMISSTEIGERHVLASPTEDWCSSVASILEGPQTITIDGEFRGLLVTGNASWTDKYTTSVLKYLGGDPLEASSWRMAKKQLFVEGHGIGHGMIVQDKDQLFYIGHRKTRREHGWEDRMVFYCPIDRAEFENYLKEI
jgi:GH43 family beta-xylosidase